MANNFFQIRAKPKKLLLLLLFLLLLQPILVAIYSSIVGKVKLRSC